LAGGSEFARTGSGGGVPANGVTARRTVFTVINAAGEEVSEWTRLDEARFHASEAGASFRVGTKKV